MWVWKSMKPGDIGQTAGLDNPASAAIDPPIFDHHIVSRILISFFSAPYSFIT
jgi:hypothetical protein